VHLRSRLLMTYRQGFPPILGTKYNTDTGWGCMLRTGQMMVAEALVQLMLGRGAYCAAGGLQRLTHYFPISRPALHC